MKKHSDGSYPVFSFHLGRWFCSDDCRLGRWFHFARWFWFGLVVFLDDHFDLVFGAGGFGAGGFSADEPGRCSFLGGSFLGRAGGFSAFDRWFLDRWFFSVGVLFGD